LDRRSARRKASPANSWEDNIKIVIECGVMVVAENREHWRAQVNISMNLPDSQKAGNFFIGSVTIILLRSLLHGVQIQGDAKRKFDNYCDIGIFLRQPRKYYARIVDGLAVVLFLRYPSCLRTVNNLQP
jgi:hypothetical protein